MLKTIELIFMGLLIFSLRYFELIASANIGVEQ